MRRFAVLVLVVAAAAAGGRPSARATTAIDLLDQYLSGQFAQVVEALAGDVDYGAILDELRRDGPAWIDAAGAEARGRRELAAATFALEAARAGEWREWKLIQKQPQMCADNGECIQPPNVLYWKAPPLLIEWGCALLRQRATPASIERWWQLAALAVAQRSEDSAFLVGDTKIGRGIAAGEIVNVQQEIKHLEHVRERFPKEMRFLLAEGIARDVDWMDDAEKAYRAVQGDPDVGGEGSMRLGAMQLRQRKMDEAMKSFERAERLTRDPYVIFLARYFSAQAFERAGRSEEAEEAYRAAAAAVPHAQSATIALASLAMRDGRRAEAQHLVAGMLAASPRPLDPWRAYVHADDRFWPQLIGRLRAEILK
jgi:tetratricopeptide (TPR) repeat protein